VESARRVVHDGQGDPGRIRGVHGRPGREQPQMQQLKIGLSAGEQQHRGSNLVYVCGSKHVARVRVAEWRGEGGRGQDDLPAVPREPW
jgi:hypothetical protein